VSALADGGPIGSDHTLLGELLQQRGLLTAEQLQAALAEQGRSRRPLGDILVALGFVPATTVAQALATQHGGLLKTEYGYATGFDAETPAGVSAIPPVTAAEPAQAVAPVAVRVLAPPVAAPPPPPPAPAVVEPAPLPVPEPAPRVVPAGLPPFAAAPAPVPAVEADVSAHRVVGLDTELAAARDVVRAFAQRAQELESERDGARVEVDDARSAAAAAEAQVAALEAELAKARAERRPEASTSVDAEAFTNRIAELEDALVVEVAGKNELETAVAERDDRIRELEELVREQPWASSERHLLFFRSADGYALVELDGPPPLPGARVDAPGAAEAQVVTRVALAPLPGHALPCAYLVAA